MFIQLTSYILYIATGVLVTYRFGQTARQTD